jgi:DNA repair exonuclease SbcCD ATPase subunit
MEICNQCPYYTTHPNVVKKTSANKTEAKIKELQLEIEECNSKINVFEDYNMVSSKIDQCKKLFYALKPNVQKLNALKMQDMNVILLSANPIWYDYDHIIHELELAVNYNDRNVIQSKLIGLKTEIDKYKHLNLDDIVKQIQEKSNLLEDTKAAILECDNDVTKYTEEMNKLNELVNDFGMVDDLRKELEVVTKLLDDDNTQLKELDNDIAILSENDSELRELQDRFNELQSEYESNKSKYDKLCHTIDTISKSKLQINDLQEKKYIYELIKDASSPQSGIPLLYVQLFLNDCISITNQLISMVLDDSVEIVGLDLSKPDMKIPYRKNGQLMEDVKSASQGERAAISLALSFAFMHKCLAMNKGNFSYNILLLDEIDAPFDSNARDKCIQILAQQIKVNNVEQVFFITHNDRYDGYPVNVIATSDVHNMRKDVPSIKVY